MNEGNTEPSWTWGTKPGFPGAGAGGWRRAELTDSVQRHGRPSQHELSPARGFEGEAEPRDGAPCPGPLSKPAARPGPERSPEEEGAGSLGEEATPRSWAFPTVCARPSPLAPRPSPLRLVGRLWPEGGSRLCEGRSASAEGRVRKSRLFRARAASLPEPPLGVTGNGCPTYKACGVK